MISPTQLPEALGAGITTLIGGGTGPAEGTKATTVTPGAWNLARMLEATDAWPVNIVLLGKGNTVSEEALWEQLRAGAAGFKLHEDWGTTPAAIDACLRVATAAGVQTAIHTDTLNEAGFVEDTLAAIAGRPIHAYHTEGAGGGHAPDIITVASQPNVLPSSTNPTRPHTVNTVDEHLDMLMVCHHLNPAVPEDLAFAESRIRPSTIAAEDILHDMGAISMIGSDSQAMGRIGEVVLRTWQTAHVMKERRGALAGYGSAPSDDGGARGADNARARRYVAKYTICPAIAHGLDGHVGSVEPGKLADLVLWHPAFFGVRPHAVLKGGFVAWAAMGDANASIPTPQPVLPRPMWGAYGDGARADVAVVRLPGRARGRPGRPARPRPRPRPGRRRIRAGARPTWSTTTPCPTSRSTRTPSPSASTASRSRPPRRRSCPWPSATSSSDDDRQPQRALVPDAANLVALAGLKAHWGRRMWDRRVAG